MSRFQIISLTAALALLIFTGLLRPVENLIGSLFALGGSATFGNNQQATGSLVRDAKIRQLERENKRLTELLDINNQAHYKTAAARVIGRSQSIAIYHVRLNKGAADGVRTGHVVLADGVVIGLVYRVSQHQSVITLIPDQQFRLEVAFGSNRGVLKGSVNGAVIDRVLPDAVVHKNQLVTTVASDQKIPADLPVGRVVRVLDNREEVFQQLQFASPVNLHELDVVEIVL